MHLSNSRLGILNRDEAYLGYLIQETVPLLANEKVLNENKASGGQRLVAETPPLTPVASSGSRFVNDKLDAHYHANIHVFALYEAGSFLLSLLDT